MAVIERIRELLGSLADENQWEKNNSGFWVYSGTSPFVKAKNILALLVDFEKECSREIEKLKTILRDDAEFVYNQAILATPTGQIREKLTASNILRLEALKGEPSKKFLPTRMQEEMIDDIIIALGRLMGVPGVLDQEQMNRCQEIAEHLQEQKL